MLKKFCMYALLSAATVAAAQERAPTATTQEEMLYRRSAQAVTRFGVSIDASALLGLGISAGIPLRNGLGLRAAYHGFSYEDEFEDESANYDADLRLRTFALLTDWHPYNGVFRVTSGLMSNGNRIKLVGKDNDGRYEVGDCTYQSSASDPLQVNGEIDFKSTAPYFGLGWGGNLRAQPGFYGTFDIGVMFSGAANVALAAAGTATAVPGSSPLCGTGPQDAAASPEVQQQLREAENEAEAKAEDYKLWPHLALGIGWRF